MVNQPNQAEWSRPLSTRLPEYPPAPFQFRRLSELTSELGLFAAADHLSAAPRLFHLEVPPSLPPRPCSRGEPLCSSDVAASAIRK